MVVSRMAGDTETCVRAPGTRAVPYGVTSTYGVGYSIIIHPHVHFGILLSPFITMRLPDVVFLRWKYHSLITGSKGLHGLIGI